MNKSESKYFNTAIKMDEALIALLEKKDFEYISVKEICTAAGVNRSTFYLHYENTVDLLDESVALMHERFTGYFDVEQERFVNEIKTASEAELMLITPEYLLPYLRYIKDHRRLYAAAMTKPSNFKAQDTYGKMFRHVFDPILERYFVPPSERPFIMSFYLGGISSLVSEWLREDCKTPIDTVCDMIIKYIVPK